MTIVKFLFVGPILCLASCLNAQVIPQLAIFPNVSYGPDPEQIMDIYLPGGRDSTVSKVILLIHGGGWIGGAKEDMFPYAAWFYSRFPRFGIVNMGYRLGTVSSPGFPKQLEDIALAIQYVTQIQTEAQVKAEFALVGASAGGHLSMLYAYLVDRGLQVNVVCNIVGPTDLTDTAYESNPVLDGVLWGLVGNETIKQNPQIYRNASPVYWITRRSPKTIAFFGGKDPLIPVSQASILEDRLDRAGVVNKVYVYPEEGHGFGNQTNIDHFLVKLELFFRTYL